MNVNSRALAEFLRANLEKVPAPPGYQAFREKVKNMRPLEADRASGEGGTFGSEDAGEPPRG